VPRRELHLCAYSRAREGVYAARTGEDLLTLMRQEECPMGLERRYQQCCPCAQVRKVGENVVAKDEKRSICATLCLFPELPNGRTIRNAEAFAGWVRREAGRAPETSDEVETPDLFASRGATDP
jgi:hypothetical protein